VTGIFHAMFATKHVLKYFISNTAGFAVNNADTQTQMIMILY